MTAAAPEEHLATQAGFSPATVRLPGLRVRSARAPVRSSPAALLGCVLVLTVVSAALAAGQIAPADPWSSVARPFQPPARAHLLGTDDLGRDLLAGIVYGARTSLIVGLAATGLSTALGLLLGALSGTFAGWVDDVLMRVTEFFQVIPRFFLALVAVALFQPGLVTITLVLGLTSWPMTARLLRAQALSIRGRDFVTAARALGAEPLEVLWRHVLPNALAPVVVHSSLMIGQTILTEASLAFLGLGDPNHISWGYLLNNAQPFMRTAWWLAVFPGLAIVLAVLGFNLVGDGINDFYVRRGRI